MHSRLCLRQSGVPPRIHTTFYRLVELWAISTLFNPIPDPTFFPSQSSYLLFALLSFILFLLWMLTCAFFVDQASFIILSTCPHFPSPSRWNQGKTTFFSHLPPMLLLLSEYSFLSSLDCLSFSFSHLHPSAFSPTSFCFLAYILLPLTLLSRIPTGRYLLFCWRFPSMSCSLFTSVRHLPHVGGEWGQKQHPIPHRACILRQWWGEGHFLRRYIV